MSVRMSKGEMRKLRKTARAEGRGISFERSENGGFVTVREHTPAEERRHQDKMERWATRYMDSDQDWR